MLEYFTYKKIKKHKAQKDAEEEAKHLAKPAGKSESHDVLDERSNKQDKHRGKHRDDGHDRGRHADPSFDSAPPVLGPDDESFLEELLAREDGPAPPLPPRKFAPDLDWPSDSEAALSEAKKGEAAASKAPDTVEKKPGRLSLFFTKQKKKYEGLKPEGVSPEEGERETKDLSRVLDRLNLSAKNNKVISTTDSSQILQKFTQIFKDLANGVPTAYDDLAKLIEDRDGTLSRGFDKLPSSLKKLVTQLPDKITGSLAPEILAAAAGSQGIKTNTAGGLKGTAKNILLPHNVIELVSKPGAIVGMLRAIVEVLKTRWPAFIGMNVIWSVALSLLLFVLWYCHKRGREVRLEREKSELAIDGSDRIEELPDDPALPAAETRAGEVGAESAACLSPSRSPAAERRETTSGPRRS